LRETPLGENETVIPKNFEWYNYPMNWFILALLSVFGLSLANIFRKVVMKEDTSDARASAIFFQLTGALMVGIIAFSKGFILPPIQTYWINILFSTVLWGLATLSLFKANQFLEASEATILSTGEALFAVAGAIILLGEAFTIQKLFGTVLIIVATFFVTYKGKGISFNKGTLYMLAYCLLAGLGVTNDTYLIRHVDALSISQLVSYYPDYF
jgi:drug/metabolite transporter (DMT)-like permease